MEAASAAEGEKHDPVPDLLTSSAFIVTYVVKLPTIRLVVTYAHVPTWITSVLPTIQELGAALHSAVDPELSNQL